MKNIIKAAAEEPHWLRSEDEDYAEFYCESCAEALAAELGCTVAHALPLGCYAPEMDSQLYCERCDNVPLHCSIIDEEE